MEEIFKILGNRLASFFTRSVSPSSFFFVLLFLNDTFFNEGGLSYEVFCRLTDINQINSVLLYVVLIVVFLAYGYINQLFTQILDNQIKNNYESCDYDFLKLRGKIHTIIKKNTSLKQIFNVIGFNDYNAYQVLGKDIKVGTSYVDDVKAIHTLAISLIFNAVILYLYFNTITDFWFIASLVFITILFHFIAKSRYKARNKRLYINYLLKQEDEKKDKKELEIKVKSIKVEIDE
mgnify:CR=1 FL=1